jgi:hypothetical protein
MNIETHATEYEEYQLSGQPGHGMARIWIHIIVDGHNYKLMHATGPKDDVKAYYDGRLTVQELKTRWADSKVPPYLNCVLGLEADEQA